MRCRHVRPLCTAETRIDVPTAHMLQALAAKRDDQTLPDKGW